MIKSLKIGLLIFLVSALLRTVMSGSDTSESIEQSQESFSPSSEASAIEKVEGLPLIPNRAEYMARALKYGKSFKLSGDANVVEEFEIDNINYSVISLTDYSFKGWLLGVVESDRLDVFQSEYGELDDAYIEYSNETKTLNPYGEEMFVFVIKNIYTTENVSKSWVNDDIDFKTGNIQFDLCLESKAKYSAAGKRGSEYFWGCIYYVHKSGGWDCVADGINKFDNLDIAMNSCGVINRIKPINELCQSNLDLYIQTTSYDYGVISCADFNGYEEHWNCVSSRYSGGDNFFDTLDMCGIQ
ncbi:hypothetical protein [Psychromonas aquimarina]|uniref:hypothetical protein n=1 Tax=Psychromonas aquimarina TaxID=444919 RepID=UPI000414068D|nr:hypothetical protein [Psychromonas aquimarina]